MRDDNYCLRAVVVNGYRVEEGKNRVFFLILISKRSPTKTEEVMSARRLECPTYENVQKPMSNRYAIFSIPVTNNRPSSEIRLIIQQLLLHVCVCVGKFCVFTVGTYSKYIIIIVKNNEVGTTPYAQTMQNNALIYDIRKCVRTGLLVKKK